MNGEDVPTHLRPLRSWEGHAKTGANTRSFRPYAVIINVEAGAKGGVAKGGITKVGACIRSTTRLNGGKIAYQKLHTVHTHNHIDWYQASNASQHAHTQNKTKKGGAFDGRA